MGINITKPSTYLNWTDGSGSKVTQPPNAQLLSGWTLGEPIPFQYLNWLFYMADQWIQWLDQSLNLDASDVNVNASMRLINGGNWSWNLGTSTLAWSSSFNLSVPSIADADNQAASGSVTLNDGEVAYLSSNIPFTTSCGTTNGSNQITPAYLDGIATGQTVTGTGIPGSTMVSSINTSTGVVTLSQNATATATNNLTFSQTGALTVSHAAIASLSLAPNTVVIARRVGNFVYVGINSQIMALRDAESKLLSSGGYDNVFTMTAGENLTAGQAVYVSSGAGIDGSRTAGSVYRTDAGSTNGSLRSQFFGIVATTATAGNPTLVICSGFYVTLALTSGAIYYLDPTTLGGITATRPSTANQYVSPVGTAASATILLLEPTASAQITAAVGVGMGSADTIAINPASQSPYNITSGNNGQVLLVNSDNGTQTFNLPAPAANLIFTIIDAGASSGFGTNNCTLHRNGSEKIQRVAADFVMAASGGAWTFSSDGTDWYISAR